MELAQNLIYRRSLVFALGNVAAISAVINLLMLVSPLYMMQVFDRVLLTHNLNTLLFLTVLTIAAFVVSGVLDGLRSIALARTGAWVEETLRTPAIAAVVHHALGRGPIAHVVQGDLNAIRGVLSGAPVVALFDLPWVPVFVVVMALIHPWFGWLAFGSTVFMLALAVGADVATRRLVRDAMPGQARLAQLMQLAASCADSVRGMGMIGALQRRQQSQAEPIDFAQDRAAQIGAVASGIARFLRLAVQAMVLALGALLAVRGDITAGGMLAASIILGRALAPVEQIIGALRSLVTGWTAFRRLGETLSSAASETESLALPAPRGYLSVESLTYTVPGEERSTIGDVSFRIGPGTVLGVVGHSGSGKSTLCRLLVGSWAPTSGHVRLDGADIHRWPREEIGSHVGYLPQSIELFGGTVAENIARLGDVDQGAVIEAAQLSFCHEFVLRLPKGYETEIGPGGAYISGGQRQRIGLARALYGRPRLIVLDEPNSNLDIEGERALVQALYAMRKLGSTVVVVTQRLNLLVAADKVAVLQNGLLEQFGDRDQVLQRETIARDKPPEQFTRRETTAFS